MAFGFIILLYVALRLSYIGATSLWNNEILSRYYGNGRAALTLGSASSLTSPTPPPTISFWCSVCLLCSASEEFSYLGCIAAADNYERGGGGKASCRLLHRTRDPAGDRGETPRLGAIERIRPHSCQRSSRAGALYGLFENGSALKLRALARRVGYCLGSGGVRTDLSAVPPADTREAQACKHHTQNLPRNERCNAGSASRFFGSRILRLPRWPARQARAASAEGVSRRGYRRL